MAMVKVLCSFCQRPMLVPENAVNAANFHLACGMESLPHVKREGLNLELLEAARVSRKRQEVPSEATA